MGIAAGPNLAQTAGAIALDRSQVSSDLDAALSADDDVEITRLISGEFLPDDR